MNTTQTNPAPALSPAAHAILADLNNPDLSTLDLCRRHALTLDQLRDTLAQPAVRRALAIIRQIDELRRPLIIAKAHADAACTLTALAARDPDSTPAAKEIRLAVKDLLRLIDPPGAGGVSPPVFSAHAVPEPARSPDPVDLPEPALALPTPRHPSPTRRAFKARPKRR